MPDATVMVADVTTKEGIGKNDKPWKLYNLIDGNGERYTTFSGDLGREVEGLKGKRAAIVYEQGERGYDLKSAVEAKEEKAGSGSRWDDPVTQRRVTVLATMKVAGALVVAGSEPDMSVDELVKRTKLVAASLALWTEEYATQEIPFA